MELKKMTVAEILTLQDQLQKELNSRTNNLVDTLFAIQEIEKKAEKTQSFFAKKVQNLKNKNKELKQIEEMGFSVFLYSHSGNIAIINYEINDKPYLRYGCEVDIENKKILTKENFYIEVNDMTKIKQILKLI
jgi:hypothetical protein